MDWFTVVKQMASWDAGWSAEERLASFGQCLRDAGFGAACERKGNREGYVEGARHMLDRWKACLDEDERRSTFRYFLEGFDFTKWSAWMQWTLAFVLWFSLFALADNAGWLP